MDNKCVCFAGHRFDWQNIGIDDKLYETIENLIMQGYETFYDGGKGYFDELSALTVAKLKRMYPFIKLIRVLSTYSHDKEKNMLPTYYTESILPDLDGFHYKMRIIKRNEWIVNHSDVLVCHIVETYKSGAYTMFKYAKRKNKIIIQIWICNKFCIFFVVSKTFVWLILDK